MLKNFFILFKYKCKYNNNILNKKIFYAKNIKIKS